MATELRTYAVTVPVGASIAAPFTQALDMPPRIVTAVRWRVPPGPRGCLGWALTMAGNHVVPWGNGNWIVADDETDSIPLTNAPSSGAWVFAGYNTGFLSHTVYLQFSLEPVIVRASAPGTTIIEVTPEG